MSRPLPLQREHGDNSGSAKQDRMVLPMTTNDLVILFICYYPDNNTTVLQVVSQNL